MRTTPGQDGAVQLDRLGAVDLVEGVVGCYALGGIPSEAVDEAVEESRRHRLIVHRLAHGVATTLGERILLDGEDVHLDVAIGRRHGGCSFGNPPPARGAGQVYSYAVGGDK